MSSASNSGESTYSVSAVSRLTGISEHALRAWERRHAAVRPARTRGGTRRFSQNDVKRLRLLAAASDEGHSIGQLAPRSDAELRELLTVRHRHDSATRCAPTARPASGPVRVVIEALDRLDQTQAEHLLSIQMNALGAQRFAREFAPELLAALGSAWAAGQVCIAAEHLGTSLLRSMLGNALRGFAAKKNATSILFATPPGERHELGLLLAAISAAGAGAFPVVLGAEVPAEVVVAAARQAGAKAVALGLVVLPPSKAAEEVAKVRA